MLTRKRREVRTPASRLKVTCQPTRRFRQLTKTLRRTPHHRRDIPTPSPPEGQVGIPGLSRHPAPLRDSQSDSLSVLFGESRDSAAPEQALPRKNPEASPPIGLKPDSSVLTSLSPLEPRVESGDLSSSCTLIWGLVLSNDAQSPFKLDGITDLSTLDTSVEPEAAPREGTRGTCPQS